MSITEGSFSLLTESQPTRVPATGLLKLGEPFTNAADGRLWVGSTDTDSLEIGLNAKTGLIAETGKFLTRAVGGVTLVNIPYDPALLDEDEYFEFYILFNASSDVTGVSYDQTVNWGAITDPLLSLSTGLTLYAKFFSYGFSSEWNAVPVWSNDSDLTLYNTTATASKGFYTTVEDSTTFAFTQRANLRFQGDVAIIDDAGGDATVIDIVPSGFTGEPYFEANSVGTLPVVTGTDALSIGPETEVYGGSSVGLGHNNVANDGDEVAIGQDNTLGSTASAFGSVVVGNANAIVGGGFNILLGASNSVSYDAVNTTTSGVLLGGSVTFTAGATTSCTQSIGIGNSLSMTQSESAVLIGTAAGIELSDDSVGIGRLVDIDDSQFAVAIGDAADINASTAGISIGRNSDVDGSPYGIAIGENADVLSALEGIAIGRNTDVGADNGIAIGFSSEAPQARSISIGWSTNIGAVGGIDSIAIGTGANNDEGITAVNDSIAIGSSATAYNDNAIALGHDAEAGGISQISIGNSANSGATSADRSIAIGDSTVTEDVVDAVVIGTNAYTDSDNSIAIGLDSYVDVGCDDSVAIGNAAIIDPAVTSAVQLGAGTNATSSTLQFLTVPIANSTTIQATTQATGIAPVSTPAAGSIIFDTSNFILYAYDGATWRSVTLT